MGVPITARTQAIVQVIATTLEGTRAALATAVPLAAGSSAKLVVLVPRIVPRPLDLEEPADSSDFFVRRYEHLVEESGAGARLEVCHCRCLSDMLLTMLDRDATIVIGGAAGRWLMSPEERLASRLTRSARRVIFVAARPVVPRRTLGPVAAVIAAVTMLAGAATASAQDVQPSRDEALRRIAALEAESAALKAAAAAPAPMAAAETLAQPPEATTKKGSW